MYGRILIRRRWTGERPLRCDCRWLPGLVLLKLENLRLGPIAGAWESTSDAVRYENS